MKINHFRVPKKIHFITALNIIWILKGCVTCLSPRLMLLIMACAMSKSLYRYHSCAKMRSTTFTKFYLYMEWYETNKKSNGLLQ